MELSCACGGEVFICPSCKKYICHDMAYEGLQHSRQHKPGCLAPPEKVPEQNEKAAQKKRRGSFSEDDDNESSSSESEKEKVSPAKKRASKKFTPKSSKQESSKKAKTSKISSSHSKSNNNNSRTVSEKCEPEKGKKKRDPEEPEGETINQVSFLEDFASPEDCTCHEKTDVSEIVFGSYEEARKQVELFIEEHRRIKKLNGKSQQCDAYTILEKDGKYLILKTNSKHAQKKNEIDKQGKTLRPAVEPELLNEEVTGAARMYIIISCPACNEIDYTDSLVVTPETDFAELLDDEDLQEKFGGKLKSVITQISRKTQAYENCRVIFVNQIQPNENPQTEQEGWTLHHSEIESYFYAKKHGWNIVKIFIDRDCCKVCGATLKDISKEDYDKIIIWED